MAQASSKQTRSSDKTPKRLFSPAFLVAVVCCLGVALVITFAANDPAPGSPGIGKPAPQIDLIRLPGDDEVAAADVTLSGKVTLLHFWGTWCGPCRMEYPELAEATQSLAEQKKFQFVPVSCEGMSGETFEDLWEKTSNFFQSEGIDSRAFADPHGITRQSMAQRLDQESLFYPTSVLIGPNGKIAGIWEGYSESGVAEITAMVKSLTASN